MKKIYILETPAYHEMDEMLFKYAVYENDVLVETREVYHEYRKPMLAGLYSIIILMKEFPQYKNQPLEIIINNGALAEQIKGTSTTKNKDIIKVAELVRKQIGKYSSQLEIRSVAGNHDDMVEWKEKLEI